METKIKGFDLSVVELDNSIIAINFDKDGKTGGYISVKLDDDGVVVGVREEAQVGGWVGFIVGCMEDVKDGCIVGERNASERNV